MSPLKTTFIGALMAFSTMALKAQTSAQVFNTNKESITNVMNTAVVNDNNDPETKEWTSGIVDDSMDAAEEYSNGYRGIGISIYTGDEGVENSIAIGKAMQARYKETYGVDSKYFVEITDKGSSGNAFVFFVNGVPATELAQGNDAVKIAARSALLKHKGRTQAKFDGYGQKEQTPTETASINPP